MNARPEVGSEPPGSFGFTPHPWRGLVLGEVHARPFHAIATPLRILHFAFLTDPEQAASGRAAFAAYCAERGVSGPADGAKHHRATFGDTVLLWEQHSEFTTHTWQIGGQDRAPFERPAPMLMHLVGGLPQPGPHLVSVDLHLAEESGTCLESVFDPASLAASELSGGKAVAGTDFRVGADGFVRFLVLDRGLGPTGAGALVQRLLELETYRTLALLGLPEAARLAPSVNRAEEALTRIAREMTRAEGLAANRDLLDEITALAAAIEADATAVRYRFGASRAYDGIVQERLATIGEHPLGDYPTLASFLLRRMRPAMRTCEMLDGRQGALSQKLAMRRTSCAPASTWRSSSRTVIFYARWTSARGCSCGCSRPSKASRLRQSAIT